MLASAGTAAAADYFSGNAACARTDGKGRLAAYFQPYQDFDTYFGGSSSWLYSPTSNYYSCYSANAPVDTEGGLHLAVYGSDGTSATVYGHRGQLGFTPQTPPANDPAGNGTPATPYKLTSSYKAGDLHVFETVTYENPTVGVRTGQAINVHYRIVNESTTTAVKFRATAAADVEPGGTRGVGYEKGSAGSRSVGAINRAQGAALELDEDSTTPWSAHMENDAFEVWRRVAKPLGSGVGGVRNQELLDAGLAVQWDQKGLTTSGLGPGEQVDFKVGWRHWDWDDSLSLTPDEYQNVRLPSGTSHTVSMTATEPDGTATNLDQGTVDPITGSAHPLRYRITGSNPTPGSGYQPLTPSGLGTASVSWQGTARGNDDGYYYSGRTDDSTYDTFSTYLDHNGNGTQDQDEPSRYNYVTWFDQLHTWNDGCDSYYYVQWCMEWTGAPAEVKLKIVDAGENLLAGKRFSYEVTGEANTVNLVDNPSLVTGDGTDFPLGEAVINVPGTQAGRSTVKVYTDLEHDPADVDSDPGTSDTVMGNGPGEISTLRIYWASRVHVTPSRTVRTAGQTAVLDLAARDTDGTPLDAVGQQLRYTVQGAGGATDVTAQLSGTLTNGFCDSFYDHRASWNDDDIAYWSSSASCTTLTLTGSGGPGRDTVTAWYDLDNNGLKDVGEPSDYGVVDWLATNQFGSQIERIRVDGNGQTNQSRTIGGDPASFAVSLLQNDGQVCASACPPLRWRVEGANPKDLATEPGPTATLQWPGLNRGYDTVRVWADENPNGMIDDGEASRYLYAYWYMPIDTDYYQSGYTRYVSEPSDRYVYFRGTNGQYLDDEPYVYTINGPDGLRQFPAAGAAPPQANNGYAEISWQSTQPGTDVLTVKADFNDSDTCRVPTPPNPCVDGFGDAPGETATFSTQWLNRVQIAVNTQSPVLGGEASVTACLYNDPSPTGRSFHWEVAGANAGATGNAAQSGSGGYSSCSVPIKWTGTNPGQDTVTVSVDVDKDGDYDVAGAQTVNWHPLDVRADKKDATLGVPRTITARLYDSAGNPLPDRILRYTVGSAIPGKPAQTTDSNGQIQFGYVRPESAAASGLPYPVYDDNIHVHADLNGNAVEDPGEPERDVRLKWYTRIVPSTNYASGRAQGSEYTVTAGFYNGDHEPMPQGTQLRYRIAGANPTTDPGTLTIGSDGMARDLDGNPGVTWLGADATTDLDGPDAYEFSPGQDRLRIWSDTNTNGAWDSGEPTSVTDVHWTPRLTVWSGNTGSLATGNERTISMRLLTLGSTSSAGKTVHWEVTGANPASGSGVTSSSGIVSAVWTGENAGTDTLTAYAEENGTAGRQSDEPRLVQNVVWTNNLSLAHVQAVGANDYVGRTHRITATLSGSGAGSPVTWEVTGANPATGSAVTDANGKYVIEIAGTNTGSDTVRAAATLGGTTYRAVATITWKPVLEVTPDGEHTAGSGNTATISVKLVAPGSDPAVAATPRDGVQLGWSVSGANSASGTVTTAGGGSASFSYPGALPGTDTVTVTAAGDDPDTVGTATVTWNAPPVTLALNTIGSATHYAHNLNTHTVEAVLSGYAVPPGGYDVCFTVTGPNPQAKQCFNTTTTTKQFSWNGPNDGTDTVTAYAELSGSTTSRDGFDPSATGTATWLPLVQLGSGGSGGAQTVGGSHTENVTILDQNGNPVPFANVIYRIDGANATSADPNAYLPRLARVAGPTQSSFNARQANGSGVVSITWTGTNSGQDDLSVVHDQNNNGLFDAGEPRSRTSVTWNAPAPSSGTTGGADGGAGGTDGTTGTAAATPSGRSAQVPPASDFDGLPTPPPPVTGRAVNIEPVSGRVLVRLPGSSRFIDLLDAEQVPVGTVVDVTKGRVELTSTKDLRGGVQDADFYAGMFKIGQNRAAKPVTDLALFGGNFKGCGKPARGGAPHGSAAANKKRVIRRLWGSGKGQFRTRGRYAAAALRGTDWETVDRCDGTLVRVRKGVVAVTDLVRRRTVVVRAGKQYFAAARR